MRKYEEKVEKIRLNGKKYVNSKDFKSIQKVKSI